ncbi:uncharacterized protein LOC132565345 [Ylistrum balloti]|uniref:uncharacterized protein LOC132565345 n=1 Tax=Ylistrum balloti TaxID=509963 RepID=UPI002905E5D0|nr:uncharacterized protein LOC132565345 [Ylistrum balloti]
MYWRFVLLGFLWIICGQVCTLEPKCLPEVDISKKNGVTPDDPFVYFGEHINLNCTVSTKQLPNNSVLIFLTKRDDGKVEEVENTILIKTDSTLTITINETITTPVKMTSKSVNYRCRLLCESGSQEVGNQYVTIDSPPQTPENLSCINYNWKRLICHLNYGTHYRSNQINITWEWTVDTMWSKCPNLETTAVGAKCTWTAVQFGVFAFRINITNDKRQDDQPVVNILKIKPPVKPEKVTNVAYQANATVASLTWSHSTNSKNLLYNLHYCSKWHSCKEEENKSGRIVLSHLVPDTEYNVSIVAQPYYNNSVSGYCSDPVDITFTTQPQVPLFNPKMQPGFYESVNNTSIILYWKNIPEMAQNGRIQLYNASSFLLENGTQVMTVPPIFSTVKNANTPQNFLIINGLCTTCKYRVELALKNVKGYSHNDSSQLFLLPVNQRPVVKHIRDFHVEALNDTYVRITWLDQKQAYAKTVRSITNYSIVWCRRKTHTDLCQGELQVKVVRKSTMEVEVNLEESFRDYRFGMSVEVQTNKGLLVSSGIVWGTAVPFLKYGVPSDAPPEVETSLTEPNGFNMTWGPYETNSPDYSPALAYQVIYCRKHNCTEVNITASDSPMKFSVTSLDPGSYNCTVRGVFSGGYGPMSIASKLVVGSPGNMGASVSGKGDNSIGIIIGTVMGVLLLFIILFAIFYKLRQVNHKAYIATKEIDVPEVGKVTAKTSGDFQGNSIDSGVGEDSKYSSEDPTRVALLPQITKDLSDHQIRRNELCKTPLIQHQDSTDQHSTSVRNIINKQNGSSSLQLDVTKEKDSGLSGIDTGQTINTEPTIGTGQTINTEPTTRQSESDDHRNSLADDVDDDGYRRPTFADSSVNSQYSPVSQDSVESYTQSAIASA